MMFSSFGNQESWEPFTLESLSLGALRSLLPGCYLNSGQVRRGPAYWEDLSCVAVSNFCCPVRQSTDLPSGLLGQLTPQSVQGAWIKCSVHRAMHLEFPNLFQVFGSPIGSCLFWPWAFQGMGLCCFPQKTNIARCFAWDTCVTFQVTKDPGY